ncbi:acyl-CoA synthetase [Alkalilimnicola sp. S0819]|uniref:acyl-CoA synthetase n=1 Tax=Alkalilimnicola sp. S0819 TaxID=2613922 RepID=UPI001262A22A|nr:long-chain fatty acid--CoA ligase [Alkalilimnicola sp. S0819]KAB7628314.1 long-chain fatty acid--CoA ligase [Alkalilimnicola sp. S0819]MPQ15212.1 AMP-binding protein [Alkalilimnicola sp. S0819]
MTIAVDWLDKRAKLSPDKVALIDTIGDRKLTYKEWDENVNRTAHFMREQLGIQKGDRVAVLATNCVEYLDVLFACNKLGSILQNLNWRLAVPELEQLIRDAKPKTLIYSAEFLDQVNKLKVREDIPCVRNFVALEEKAGPIDISFFIRDRFPAHKPDTPSVSLDHPWVICYTGGTTGLPKGAIQTHGNITWNAINTVMSWGVGAEDTAILNAPLFHTGGLNVFTAPLVQAGGTSIVCKTFDVDQVFDLVETGDVSVFFGVPTMFTMMQNHERWETADFSKLKVVISGGAPCPMPVFERFWAKGVDFKTGYGLTEAGPNTFWLPPEQVREKPGFVGYPLFHVACKLVDEQGVRITTPDVAGELCIRGPHRTPGYWNNPEATAEAIDEDGWLHTGDLAIADADGAYKIVGRAKDMYISGGENVYPAEVESIMHSHPAVSEAALFGIPDDKWGEVGCAVIALKRDQNLDEATMIQFLKDRVAHYKVPRHVRFVEELPKTGAGKISKKVLKERYGKIDEAS